MLIFLITYITVNLLQESLKMHDFWRKVLIIFIFFKNIFSSETSPTIRMTERGRGGGPGGGARVNLHPHPPHPKKYVH